MQSTSTTNAQKNRGREQQQHLGAALFTLRKVKVQNRKEKEIIIIILMLLLLLCYYIKKKTYKFEF